MSDEPLPEGVWDEPPPPGPIPSAVDEPHAPPARLTVVSSFYHQPPDGEARAFHYQYEHPLLSEEEPYSRRVKLTEEWVKLDKGWIEEASCVVVVPQGKPDDGQTIEVSCGHEPPVPCHLVPPGGWHFHPADAGPVYFRVTSGKMTCVVTVLPR